jgi:hypothetical protein
MGAEKARHARSAIGEYSNPRLKINTSGGYVYFAMRMAMLL